MGWESSKRERREGDKHMKGITGWKKDCFALIMYMSFPFRLSRPIFMFVANLQKKNCNIHNLIH
jgi:hypothetical protein